MAGDGGVGDGVGTGDGNAGSVPGVRGEGMRTTGYSVCML